MSTDDKGYNVEAADKARDRLGRIDEVMMIALKAGADRDVMSTLADCERALKRAARRSEQAAEWEAVEIVQTRGPTLEFAGRLLAETEFRTQGRQPMNLVLEVFETRGGALVAVSAGTPIDGEGFEDTRALVVEPEDDVLAMRFAVMDHFQWSDRARSMLRKQAGWQFRQVVD